MKWLYILIIVLISLVGLYFLYKHFYPTCVSSPFCNLNSNWDSVIDSGLFSDVWNMSITKVNKTCSECKGELLIQNKSKIITFRPTFTTNDGKNIKIKWLDDFTAYVDKNGLVNFGWETLLMPSRWVLNK